MSSVSSANSASSTLRVAAPAAPRPVDGVAVAGKDSAGALAAVQPARTDASAPKGSATATATPAAKLTKAELTQQVQALQAKMDKLNPALAFVVDQDSGRALIQLTDRATKEVIQQFPSEAAMQISKALDRFEKGQLINLTV